MSQGKNNLKNHVILGKLITWAFHLPLVFWGCSAWLLLFNLARNLLFCLNERWSWYMAEENSWKATLCKRVATLGKSSFEVKDSLSSYNPELLLSTCRYKRESSTWLSLQKWLLDKNALTRKVCIFSNVIFVHRNLIKPWSATCQTCCLLQAPALLRWFQEAFAKWLVYYIKIYALGKVGLYSGWMQAREGCDLSSGSRMKSG